MQYGEGKLISSTVYDDVQFDLSSQITDFKSYTFYACKKRRPQQAKPSQVTFCRYWLYSTLQDAVFLNNIKYSMLLDTMLIKKVRPVA